MKIKTPEVCEWSYTPDTPFIVGPTANVRATDVDDVFMSLGCRITDVHV